MRERKQQKSRKHLSASESASGLMREARREGKEEVSGEKGGAAELFVWRNFTQSSICCMAKNAKSAKSYHDGQS